MSKAGNSFLVTCQVNCIYFPSAREAVRTLGKCVATKTPLFDMEGKREPEEWRLIAYVWARCDFITKHDMYLWSVCRA